MTIKLILYVITVPLSIWALDSVNINGVFKSNKVIQARILYLLISFSLSYLFTNFLYDFFIIKVIKIDLFVNISTYNLIFYCIKKSHQIKFDTIFLTNLFSLLYDKVFLF